ncbi:MAG: hypothetical protein GXW85_07465 [Clostridia bacterium]|nr:hypothetical protein [Clostridia bacterium]
MKKKAWKSWLVIFLIFFFLIAALWPAYAQEINSELSIEDIQELAVKNNRSLKTIDHLISQSTHAGYIYNNEYKRSVSNSIGRYVMGAGDIAKKRQIDEAIKKYEELGFQEGKSPSAYPGLEDEYNYYISLKLTSAMLGTSISSTADLIEGQLDILSAYGIANSNSLTKELKSKRDEARNTTDDLKKLKEDSEKQIRQMAALLGLEALNLQNKIDTLDKAYNQYLKMTEVERLKKQNGLNTKSDVSNLAVETSSYGKQLKYARANLNILKNNINDLMGRDVNTELKISKFSIPEVVEPAPNVDQVIKDALENSYYFVKTERDLKDLKDDLDDIEDSNKKQIKKDELSMLELERESKRSEIVNKVKAIHASYEEKAKAYELAIVKFKTMEDEYNWDKLRCENGLISKLMLTGTEVKYLQALTEKIEAGYDYYIVKQELALAQKGVFMPDDYTNLKNSLN